MTASNSSGINGGAAALVIVEERLAERLGLAILGSIRPGTVVGVDPNMMGIGLVPSVTRLLSKTRHRATV